MKLTELKDKTIEELTRLALELDEQLRATKTAIRTSTYTRSHELGNARKLRAQVLTILSQKRTLTRP